MNKKITTQLCGNRPIDYHRLAPLWQSILERPITPAQVALCIHQFHLNQLIDNPHCRDTTVKMAETIFAYEALLQASEDSQQ